MLNGNKPSCLGEALNALKNHAAIRSISLKLLHSNLEHFYIEADNDCCVVTDGGDTCESLYDYSDIYHDVPVLRMTIEEVCRNHGVQLMWRHDEPAWFNLHCSVPNLTELNQVVERFASCIEDIFDAATKGSTKHL